MTGKTTGHPAGQLRSTVIPATYEVTPPAPAESLPIVPTQAPR
jgi:hypothetical protein